MLSKLLTIYNRFQNLEEQLSDPGVTNDQQAFRKISKEYKDLQPVIDAYKRYQDVVDGIASAKEMAKDEDQDMRAMAREELHALEKTKDEMDEELKMLLIPKDPDDSKDVILEIRSGTGGDEAAIFAGDLLRMYSRFFETKGFKVETLELTDGTAGGYSKVSLEVSGEEVYGTLKFESGAHRVQRVPATEARGRVHTSAATVVVMPKREIEDINVNKADLKTDTFRSSGAGGQHVNKTESGVRFTHLPTGIVAESTEARSQIKNREIALQRLIDKIAYVQLEQFNQEIASARKSLVGKGDRSEKIRTYNYPQNRMTDHRINLTMYSLDKIMEGDIQEIIDALIMAENMAKLEAGETL